MRIQGGTRSREVGGLTRGNTYAVRLRAVATSGEVSVWASASITAPFLSPPRNVHGMAVAATCIKATWTPPETQVGCKVRSYQVELKEQRGEGITGQFWQLEDDIETIFVQADRDRAGVVNADDLLSHLLAKGEEMETIGELFAKLRLQGQQTVTREQFGKAFAAASGRGAESAVAPATVSASSREMTLSQLKPGVTYALRICAVDDVSGCRCTWAYTEVPPIPLIQVAVPKAIVDSPSALSISWDEPEVGVCKIVSYEVQVSDKVEPEEHDWLEPRGTAERSLVISGLQPSVPPERATYVCRVCVLTDLGGASAWSGASAPVILPAVNAPVSPKLEAVAGKPSSLMISWLPGETVACVIEGYDVEVFEEGSATPIHQAPAGADSCELELTNLQAVSSSSYQCSIVAIATCMSGARTSITTFRSKPASAFCGSAPRVKELRVEPLSWTSLRLCWTIPEEDRGDVENYEAEVKAEGAERVRVVGSVADGATELIVENGLLPGATYACRVKPVMKPEAGKPEGAFCDEVLATLPELEPPWPLNVSIAPSESQKVMLHVAWDAPTAHACTLHRCEVQVVTLYGDETEPDNPAAWKDAGMALASQCKLLVDSVSQGPPSGLRWRNAGADRPTTGVELINEKLSKALETKLSFTQDEWHMFGIKDLRKSHFIMSGASYIQLEGACYAFRARSVADVFGPSAWSPAKQFQLPSTVRSVQPPTNVQLQSVGEATIDEASHAKGPTCARVTWEAARTRECKVLAYTVQLSADGGTNWEPAHSVIEDADMGLPTELEVCGLVVGRRYMCRVCAETDAEEIPASQWSELGVTTLPALLPPLAPTLSLTADGPALLASWQAPEPVGCSVLGYEMELSTNTWKSGGRETSVAHGILDGIEPGETYWVRVRARTEEPIGWSKWSEATERGFGHVPTPELLATLKSETVWGVEWSVVESQSCNIFDYEVQWREADTDVWQHAMAEELHLHFALSAATGAAQVEEPEGGAEPHERLAGVDLLGYDLSGLPGAKLQIRVRALSDQVLESVAGEEGAPSGSDGGLELHGRVTSEWALASLTLPLLPAPSQPDTKASGRKGLVVSWAVPIGLSAAMTDIEYTLEYVLLADLESAERASFPFISVGDALEHALRDLKPGASYELRVRVNASLDAKALSALAVGAHVQVEKSHVELVSGWSNWSQSQIPVPASLSQPRVTALLSATAVRVEWDVEKPVLTGREEEAHERFMLVACNPADGSLRCELIETNHRQVECTELRAGALVFKVYLLDSDDAHSLQLASILADTSWQHVADLASADEVAAKLKLVASPLSESVELPTLPPPTVTATPVSGVDVHVSWGKKPEPALLTLGNRQCELSPTMHELYIVSAKDRPDGGPPARKVDGAAASTAGRWHFLQQSPWTLSQLNPSETYCIFLRAVYVSNDRNFQARPFQDNSIWSEVRVVLPELSMPLDLQCIPASSGHQRMQATRLRASWTPPKRVSGCELLRYEVHGSVNGKDFAVVGECDAPRTWCWIDATKAESAERPSTARAQELHVKVRGVGAFLGGTEGEGVRELSFPPHLTFSGKVVAQLPRLPSPQFSVALERREANSKPIGIKLTFSGERHCPASERLDFWVGRALLHTRVVPVTPRHAYTHLRCRPTRENRCLATPQSNNRATSLP